MSSFLSIKYVAGIYFDGSFTLYYSFLSKSLVISDLSFHLAITLFRIFSYIVSLSPIMSVVLKYPLIVLSLSTILFCCLAK